MRRSGRTDHRASPQGACAVRPRRAYGPRAARGPRPRPAPTRLQQVARRSGLRASLQRRRWKLPPPEPSRTAFRPGPLAFACICCVRIRSSRSSRDHLTLRRVPRSTRVRVALSRSPVRDGLPPAAYQGGLETVLEEEEFEIPPRAVQGPETAKGWEPTALAASSSISRHERDTDSRSCVEIPGREAGSASARSAAYASHQSMVPLAASILPAARETTSSGSPSPGFGGQYVERGVDGRVGDSGPGDGRSDCIPAEIWFPQELARFSQNSAHRRSFENDTMALRGPHARGLEPRSIYLYAFGEVDVGKEGWSLDGATGKD